MSSMSVSIKEAPAVRVLSLRGIVPAYNQQRRLWDELCAFAAQHGLGFAGPCFAIYHDPEHKERDVDMEVCIPIHEDADVPEAPDAITVRQLPALTRAATTIHHGPFENLPAVYEALFAWIRDHGEAIGGLVREVCQAVNHDDPRANITEIQVPLTSK